MRPRIEARGFAVPGNATAAPLGAGLSMLAGLTVVFLMAASTTSLAHETGASYLKGTFQDGVFQGRWDLPLKDLQDQWAASADLGKESEAATPEQIIEFVEAQLRFRVNNRPLELTLTPPPDLGNSTDGEGDVPDWEIGVSGPYQGPVETLEVQYQLLFEGVPSHRGLIYLEVEQHPVTAIFSPTHTREVFRFTDDASPSGFGHFVIEGVWHIWIGVDHILFLLTLLMPSVLVLDASKHWRPCERFRDAFLRMVWVVTAFALSHSLTLTAASLNWVTFEARWIESAIALTVMLTAANNIWPMVHRRLWLVAFGLGLIHGFGFANVLGDLDMPGSVGIPVMAAFNLGVEIGQLAIVAVVFPLLFVARRSPYYRGFLLIGGSLIIGAIALVWFIERAF